MNPNPLVSIIIPNYNRAHLIGETLNSILAQTYTNWECIIVDDGSTDNSEFVISKYVENDFRFKFFHRPIDRIKGANVCRNYGFELSEGEYVNWFDSDDIMHHDKLLKQVNALEKSNYNFSVCQTLVFENSLENVIGLRSENIYSNDIFYDYVTQKISWLTQAPLWKRNFLNSIEYLFDEELQAAQEWEFHCRVLSLSNDYDVINDPLVYIRRHNNSISHNNDSKMRIWNYFLARNKVYTNGKVILSEQVSLFLQDYLLANFKKNIRLNYLEESSKMFFIYIVKEKKFKLRVKFYAFLSIISFFLINRGYLFLKKVKY